MFFKKKKEKHVAIPKLDSVRYVEALNNHDFGLMAEMSDEIEDAWKSVYDAVQAGGMLAYYDSNRKSPADFLRYILHKSTRHEGYQLSCLWMNGAETIPMSHREIYSEKDFLEATSGSTAGYDVRLRMA